MKKISIIIPCYNHAAEIGECLRSVFAQTYAAVETVVVDDGSTDALDLALVPYRDRLTLIRQQNKGGPAARNLGFRSSTGDLVMFCDADAVLRPDALEKMAAALEAHPHAAYAYASFTFGWKNFPLGPFDAERLTRHNYIPTGSLIRREAFPGFDESLKRFQDWDVWLTMLEKGDRGVWVPERLLRIRVSAKRGGISAWLPKLAYRLPWRLFGWKPTRVATYEAAADIIRKKHGLTTAGETSKLLKTSLPLLVFFSCMALEGVSYAGWHVPGIRVAALALLAVVAAVLARVHLRWLFALVMIEMIIGSHGRLLFAPVSGFSLSLRMALFGALVIGWLLRPARLRRGIRRLRETRLMPPLLLLLAAVVLAVLRAVAARTSLAAVFNDANGYAFLVLIPIGLDLFSDAGSLARLSRVLSGAVAWLCVKSLLLLYLFSHAFNGAFLRDIFLWQRKFGLTEITPLSVGGVRVFAASDVVLLPALFLGALLLWEHRRRAAWLWTSLVAAAFLLSLSRSFWLGAAAAVLCLLPAFVHARVIPFARLGRLIGIALGALTLGVLLLAVSAAFPLPAPSHDASAWTAHGGGRLVSASDEAVSSRWHMLKPLRAGIAASPLLGQGFGAEITYQSDDPRMHDLYPNGIVTTGAIEWQYLEIWLKMGLLGLAAFAWLGWRIGALAWKSLATAADPTDRIIAAASALAFSAFIVANIFTPYLNHPLGWAYLASVIMGLGLNGERRTAGVIPASPR